MKMIAEMVTPDTFDPPHHELSTAVQNDFDLLLKGYESQFAKEKLQLEPHL